MEEVELVTEQLRNPDDDFGGFSIEQCDVIDKENLTKYRNCYRIWHEALKGEMHSYTSSRNTLWSQLVDLIQHYHTCEAFRRANKKLKDTSPHKRYHYLAINDNLNSLIDINISHIQPLSIRKLTDGFPLVAKKEKDKGKTVYSLKNLLEHIKQHTHHITREAYVCFDGTPYEYEEEINKSYQFLHKNFDKLSDDFVWQLPYGATNSKERHAKFDHIIGITDESQRQPSDYIPAKHWTTLQGKLGHKEFQDIRTYVNKRIAHASTMDLSILPPLAYKNIESCHKILIALFQEIATTLLHSSLDLSTTALSELTRNFHQPFVTEEIAQEVQNELDKEREELTKILGITT